MGSRGRSTLYAGLFLATVAEIYAGCNGKCKTPPHYDLPSCPAGSVGCMNVVNKCGFPVWPVMAVGSPPVVQLNEKVTDSLQWTFPAKKGSAWGAGGRLYFYYKDPATIPNFPQGKVPYQAPQVPEDYAQLGEFMLDWDAQQQSHFLDVDVSSVDTAALPVYMYAGNNCGGKPGAQCQNQECVKSYSTCPASTFYNECPCHQQNYVSEIGVGQCLSPGLFCANPQNANSTCCQTFNQPRYQAIVNGTNPPATIYGCHCNEIDCKKCTAINRGICSDPSDASKCPVPEWDHPSQWYIQGQDQNAYSAWVHQTTNNTYGFSLDEGTGGGNTQCRYGTQLDIVLCPSCNQDDDVVEVLV